MPELDDIGLNKKRHLHYIYEFDPITENLKWLRLDTFIDGTWGNHGYKYSRNNQITKISKHKQRKIYNSLKNIWGK